MDTRWLRVLVDLEALGTLRAVADANGYSTSAVSQNLARLQDELGHRLVEQVGRRLVLTPAGEAFLPRAQAILREYEAGRGLLAGVQGISGTVLVAGYATALASHVVPAARGIRAAHPELEVRMEEREPDEVRGLLARARADVGVVYDYSVVPDPGPGEPYAEVPLVLAVREGEARGADKIITDPATAWIGNSRGKDDDEIVRLVTSETGTPARIVHRIDSLDLVAQLVARGEGAAFLASDAPRGPGVRYLDIGSRAGTRRSYAVTRPGHEHWPPVAAVIDAIHRAAAGARTRVDPLP